MINKNSIVNLGIDIISKNRIDLNNHLFLKKILSIKEKDIFDSFMSYDSKISFVASRWAAKEAVYKALNNKDILFINIEILNDINGKPYCSNFEKVALSITHSEIYCIAIAFLLK
ncbi:MAG: 4'-phosphopantetheinyl transferase superfamily protein [Mycoplasmoidaceae bacterium]